MRLSPFTLADVFKHGVWPELDDFSDPELKELVPAAALQSRAPKSMLEDSVDGKSGR